MKGTILIKHRQGDESRGSGIDIVRLWHEGSEAEWRAALEKYYENENVFEGLEDHMNHVKPEMVRNMSADEFYEFIHDKYFDWKFTDGRICSNGQKRLEKTYDNASGKKELFEIKEDMFKIHDFAPENTRLLFNVVRGVCGGIVGLGIAGASGLLAIIWPGEYGTVDQFVVEALLEIEDLPEQEQIKAIKYRSNLKLKEGILLEDILRRKAKELNEKFGTDEWTPKKVDMILWTYRNENK